MKIKEWSWRNVCSYGNKITTVDVLNDPQLILVHGENGAGKSSIAEALTVSVYGRSVTRKMKDIPNRMNKNAYTKVIFESNSGDQVVLERGIDPNYSNLQINGAQYNLPDKRKVDEFIEDQIVKIPLTVFSNTVNLSIDDFKSFIQLSPSDKRKVVDKIFGLDEINQMSLLLKEETKLLKSEVSILESSIDKNKQHLQKSISQLEETKQSISIEKQREIEVLKLKIEQDTTRLDESKAAGVELNKDIKSKQLKIDDLTEQLYKNRTSASVLTERVRLLELGKCSKCGTDLTDHDHVSELSNTKDALNNLQTSTSEILIQKNEADQVIEKLRTSLDRFRKTFTELSSSIMSSEMRISELERQMKLVSEVASIQAFIDKLQTDITESEVEYFAKKEKLAINLDLEGALSDSGIKKIIMGNIIPILNQKLLKISKVLEFKFAFEFDEDFNAIVKHIGHEISAESLSTGEKKKMNLVILLSMIEIIMMKQNGANILFLDEIFTGLDKNAVFGVVDILKTFARKYRMTIFVASHEWLPEEFFDSIMSVKNIDNFSEMEIKKI